MDASVFVPRLLFARGDWSIDRTLNDGAGILVPFRRIRCLCRASCPGIRFWNRKFVIDLSGRIELNLDGALATSGSAPAVACSTSKRSGLADTEDTKLGPTWFPSSHDWCSLHSFSSSTRCVSITIAAACVISPAGFGFPFSSRPISDL